MANSGQRCETSIFEFQNLASEEIVEMKIVQLGRSYRFSVGRPAMVTMEPGAYEIISGECQNTQFQTIVYSDIKKWFKPFKIQSGDVRFLGNLNVSAAKGVGRNGLAYAAVGRVLGMGANPNKPVDYVVLKIVDAPSSAKSALRINYPDLVENFVSAPLEARIDSRAFREIVADAYSLDENGKAPLKKEAHKIVKEYINKFD